MRALLNLLEVAGEYECDEAEESTEWTFAMLWVSRNQMQVGWVDEVVVGGVESNDQEVKNILSRFRRVGMVELRGAWGRVVFTFALLPSNATQLMR